MIANLYVTGVSGMEGAALEGYHLKRVKLLSFSQLSSIFRIRVLSSNKGIIAYAYYCQSTNTRYVFAFAGTFLAIRYLKSNSSFMTFLT